MAAKPHPEGELQTRKEDEREPQVPQKHPRDAYQPRAGHEACPGLYLSAARVRLAFSSSRWRTSSFGIVAESRSKNSCWSSSSAFQASMSIDSASSTSSSGT